MKKKLFEGLGKFRNKVENVTNTLFENKDTKKSLQIIISALSQQKPSQSLLSTLNYYYSPYELIGNPILFIAVVSFHHKKGSIIEFTYPEKDLILIQNESYFNELRERNQSLTNSKLLEEILGQLTCLCLPDGAHLINEDNQFFFIQEYKHLLYGISCYKQLRVTAAIKEDDQENTRECVQKAICVVSKLPLFGQFVSKLSIAISTFFEQNTLKDKTIIEELYNNYSNLSLSSLNINEVLISFSLKKLFFLCEEKIFTLMKLLMLEKKIAVYSHISSNVCSFIFSLLSLFPGNSFFNLNYGDNINNYLECYRKIGLPLKFLNSKSRVYPICTLYEIEKISSCSSYLIGTTNPLLLSNNYLKCDCIINIDTNKIAVSKDINERLTKLSKLEKKLYKYILSHCNKQEINNDSWIIGESTFQSQYEGSDDYLRNEFKSYIINFLFDMSLVFKLIRFSGYLNEIKFIDEVTTFDSSDEEDDKKTEEKKEIHYVRKLLKGYNIDFIAEWIQTINCSIWLKEHDDSISNRSYYVEEANDIPIVYENGDVYKGTISMGKRNGYGCWSHKDFVYEGEWKNDKKDGKGNMTCDKDSYIYEGEWKNDKKEGNGKVVAKGLNYTGGFKE